MNKPGWVVFVVPTLVIAFDLMITSVTKGLYVDFAHYLAQFVWVVEACTKYLKLDDAWLEMASPREPRVLTKVYSDEN
jgi:hypothetical protein